MKKGINFYSLPANRNYEDYLKLAKNAGFDGIELNVDGDGHSAHSLTLATTEDELKAIAGLSARHALPVVSISTSLYGGLMGSRETNENGRAKQILLKQLQCAKALGASGILVVPGGISEEVSIAEAFETSAKTLASCMDAIKDYKICVGVENVWNQFFTSAFDMKSFIDVLDKILERNDR